MRPASSLGLSCPPRYATRVPAFLEHDACSLSLPHCGCRARLPARGAAAPAGRSSLRYVAALHPSRSRRPRIAARKRQRRARCPRAEATATAKTIEEPARRLRSIAHASRPSPAGHFVSLDPCAWCPTIPGLAPTTKATATAKTSRAALTRCPAKLRPRLSSSSYHFGTVPTRDSRDHPHLRIVVHCECPHGHRTPRQSR